jgi:hypothetical protein
VEPLYLFVFTHYPTQNRYALLLEMLSSIGIKTHINGLSLVVAAANPPAPRFSPKRCSDDEGC